MSEIGDGIEGFGRLKAEGFHSCRDERMKGVVICGKGNGSVGESEGCCEMEGWRGCAEGEDLKLVGDTRFHQTTTTGYGVGGGGERNQ